MGERGTDSRGQGHRGQGLSLHLPLPFLSLITHYSFIMWGQAGGPAGASGSDPDIPAVWALVQVRNTIYMTQLGAMNGAIG